MSDFIARFRAIAQTSPDSIAFRNSSGQSITYAQLDAQSDAVAAHLAGRIERTTPVIVYGHKSPLMLVSFLGALKSGSPYVPIDTIYPRGRVADILEQLGSVPVICTNGEDLADVAQAASLYVTTPELESIVAQDAAPLAPEASVAGNEIMYILFTSGSTGRPKGVQMNAGSIDCFMGYFIRLNECDTHEHTVFFNRVPYTFDVSLFDMVPGLSTGAELYSLDTEAEGSMAATFEALRASNMNVWVSTPSFMEACLADPSFGAEMLPCLRQVVLCGEVLRNQVSAKILERFPGVRLSNTYGPTETQSVTDIDVTPELIAECDPLPVGYLQPEMRAIIRDPETLAELPVGEIGEIYLAGGTVSRGYFGRPDLTQAAFSQVEGPDGQLQDCYKTGDKGYLDAQGRLFCLGRFDFQVKLNGFRVELAEVEENICNLPDVQQTCVVPVERNGAVSHLCAWCVLADPAAPRDFKQTKALKAQLEGTLPAYMIPRSFKYLDEFPTNANGKIDRKLLTAQANGRDA